MSQWELDDNATDDPFAGLGLTLTGRWSNGGVLVLRWGDDGRSLNLPATMWAPLALLVRKAMETGTEAGLRAYLTPAELTRALRRTTELGSPDAIRSVHRLRERLEERLDNWPPARHPDLDWRTLVETHETLGYGLPVPADRLELVLLDEEPDDTGSG